MQALFENARGHSVELDMPLSDFLATRLMERRARAALCTPGELVAGYLPVDYATLDSEELSLALAEACETATEFAVSRVKLNRADVRFAQRRLEGLYSPEAA
jgi:hypothetical protein